MPFHLPGENIVVSKDNSSMEDVIENEGSSLSMLLAWMEINKLFEEACNYTYAEFPQYFVWNKQGKIWRRRKSRRCIGRLYYSHPSKKERFYLRMLLHVVKGCTSFEDIRSVNGVLYKSFQEACYARGLLAEDNEWNDCINEVSTWASGHKLRELFVTILINCPVSDCKGFWDKNWTLLSDDILYHRRKELKMPNLQLSDAELKDLCLMKIEKLLQRHWKSFADFPGLPTPSIGSMANTSNRLLAEELNYNCAELQSQFVVMCSQLNIEQKAAYDEILDSVYGDKGCCFFVDGFGGTGKTFLWKVICLKLRSEGKIVLCVASSGIAALLMSGGRTAHSRFNIPVDIHSKSTCHIEQGSDLAEVLQRCSLIIWDEAPMSHKHCVEAVDRTLRDILRVKYPNSENLPFGGMTVVLGGDFRQTLPVIVKGTRSDVVNSSIKKSKLWHYFRVLRLKKNMRLVRDGCSIDEGREIAEFSKWILTIGDGEGSNVFGESIISIPKELSVERKVDHISDIVAEVYGGLSTHYCESSYFDGRAILAPHHDMVSALNHYVLEQYPGEVMTYFSSDSIDMDPGNQNIIDSDYSTEFLNSLKIGNFPEHELKLKLGCPVILLRNIDQSRGLCNGTRLIVKTLGTWFIELEIISGSQTGDRVFLPRMTLTHSYKSLNFTLVRRQFPIALCFAMTINKSQGQTLQNVGLCLQKQVFSHGQLYVALSRVTTKRGIKILSCDGDGAEVKSMQNIVYREIFD
ncbi:unnamed protein product [Linum trigynum]|uniref:ATP-dependent DNA helicase n=1 Tax=Linum trigynum TaxID=586398 RepID=A0AAV2EJ55_9ROSI